MNREPPNPIAAADIAAYERDGVVCLRRMFDPDWIAVLAAGVEEAMAKPGPHGEIYTKPGNPGRFFGDLDMWQRLAPFRQSLEPMRVVLAGSPFLGGDTATYADYAVFGAFQWARCTSPFKLIADDDPIFVWQRRLRALFDGLADSVPAFD